MEKDNLGSRMKEYEAVETKRSFRSLYPVYARLDGKSFSRFTRGMDRPYDSVMTQCMINTTKKLVEHTNACVGYTQSDEISLAWYAENEETQIFFNSRVQKMVSVLSGLATSYFTLEALQHWPERVQDLNPIFDSRVIQMPSKNETANMFLWREFDATKNAIAMAAQHYFSHKSLHGVNGKEMTQRLLDDEGVVFEDYPASFKRGTFIQRKRVLRDLTSDELAKIPEEHRPNGPIERSETFLIDMPSFTTVTNRARVLFEGEEPEVE